MYVSIGGIDQYLEIRGGVSRRPILLRCPCSAFKAVRTPPRRVSWPSGILLRSRLRIRNSSASRAVTTSWSSTDPMTSCANFSYMSDRCLMRLGGNNLYVRQVHSDGIEG